MTTTQESPTVIIIPAPTVNGPLHIGHLSGPFLAADVASRAARANGHNILTLAGVDAHPNYVMTKAETLGLDPHEMVDMYHRRIVTAWELAGIGYDIFINPREKSFETAIDDILNDLVADGTLEMRELTLHACADCGRTLHHSYVVGTCWNCGTGSNGLSCEACGSFTSAQSLDNASCARCGGAPREMLATVPVLPIEKFRDRLVTEWMRAELPGRVRTVLDYYLHNPLPDYPVAYPTDWGIEGTRALAGLRIDFAAELGLSYLYGPAHHVRPEAGNVAEWAATWAEIDGLWHFNGIDNAFYFAILYPCLFAAAGVAEPQMRGATVNELYLLEGKKFSTSRNHALWADEFLATEDPALVRLFLSWDRPDRYESDFTDVGYRAFCAMIEPLLAGDRTAAGLPAALAEAELRRADLALELVGFDASLAIRCVVNALTSGHGLDSAALSALAGPTRKPTAA